MEIILWVFCDLLLQFPIHIFPLYSNHHPVIACRSPWILKENRERNDKPHEYDYIKLQCDTMTRSQSEYHVKHMQSLRGLSHWGNLSLDCDSWELVTTYFYNRVTHYKSMSFWTVWKGAVLRISTFSTLIFSTSYIHWIGSIIFCLYNGNKC